DWALLEKFVEACSLASVQTMNGLEAKGITTEIIGKLQEIYLWSGGELDDGPDTGATAAPIAALCLAAAAGFVFMKFRKK
ncbi:MAG: LPXTG cell wall anchor domain-containing protein, partial [Acutalibacteraceae bacterium]